MNGNYRLLLRRSGIGALISLLFVVLALTLGGLLTWHWVATLEPSLVREAHARANALAQAQARGIEKVLGAGSRASLMALEMVADEILSHRDPENHRPFVSALAIELDYDAIQAPPGSLELRRGITRCPDCLVSVVPLYGPDDKSLIGLATFDSSTEFLRALTAEVRGRLLGGGAAALALLLVAWLAVVRLLQRLHASQDNLRNLFEVVPFPLLLLRCTDGAQLRSNRAAQAYDLRGVTPHGLGGRCASAAPDSESPACVKPDGVQCNGCETTLPGADGKLRRVMASAMTVNYFGQPTRLIGFADITSLKQVQEELHQAKEGAEQATRAKSRFLATMSHEIRTPLTAILGFAELLERGRLEPKQREQVESIRDAGEVLLGLVSDILDFSRIESGRLELEPTDFDLPLMLHRTVEMFRLRAEQKGLRLELECPRGATRWYRGDANRLRQILLNLIGNAVKFTETGGVRVRLEATPGDDADQIRIEVGDSGIGIPQESLGGLFDEFHQSDNSITRRYGGSGLGLAISRRLIALMGGSIGVESEVGQGSRFRVELALPRGTEPPAEDASPLGAMAPRRILLVDDISINRMVIKGMLADDGHHIREAANGAEAVAAVESEPYDLILLDLHMPIMGGYEAARRIRALADAGRAATPIVALTADVTPECMHECRAAAIDDWISKPLEQERLLQVLHKYGPKEAGVFTSHPPGVNLPP